MPSIVLLHHFAFRGARVILLSMNTKALLLVTALGLGTVLVLPAMARNRAMQGGRAALLPSHSNSAPGGSLHQVTVRDEGFNIPAFTMDIPAGWKIDGGVIRTVNCSLGDPFLVFSTSSPDELYSGQILSPYFTFWPNSMNTNLQGCGEVRRPMSAAEVLTNVILPKLRHGLKYSAPVAALPDDAEQEVKDVADMTRDAATQGVRGVNFSGSTARVHGEYTIHGKPVEEWITAMTEVTAFAAGRSQLLSSKTVVSVTRAPKGQWNEALWNFVKTIKPLPEWQRRQMEYGQQVAQHGAQTRQQMAAQAQANINATIARTNATIDSIHATGARSNAAVDAIHRTGAASMQADRERMGAIDWSAKGTAAYVGDNYQYITPEGKHVWTNTPADANSGWQEVR
jgi:hypothetical protein